MCFQMVMCHLPVTILLVGLMPVELLPIESVTEQDMFFEQGNRLVKKIKTHFFQKTTFFESPITQKRFIFEQSYISYGKRQKSCTLIVI